MLRLFSYLWYGHHHKWEFVKTMKVFENTRKSSDDELPIKSYEVWSCSVCKKQRRVDL